MSIFLLFSSTAVCLVSLAAVFLRHHATLLLTIATNEWSHQDFIHVKVTQQLLLSVAMLCPQLLHMHRNYYTYMNYKDNFYHLA